MNCCILSVSALCLAVSVSARPLFDFSEETIRKLQEHPASKNVLLEANGYLSVQPMDDNTFTFNSRNKEHELNCFGHYVGRRLQDWMKALGWAYRISGEEKYAKKGTELLLATCRYFPVEHHWITKKGSMAGGRGDVMCGIAMGTTLFYDRLSREQLDELAKVAAGYVKNFISEAEDPGVWWKNVHNFNGVCGGAAGMLTLVFEDYPEVAEHRDHCAAIVERWFDNSIDPEGAYAEGAGYSQYGYMNSLLFAWLLKERGGKDLFQHARLRKLPVFFAASMLPGTTQMENRNDSALAAPSMECLHLAVQNQDGLAAWLWQRAGTNGYPYSVMLEGRLPKATPPEQAAPKDMLFPERGLCVWRTGWGKQDVMFSTEAGHYYHITHNQSDKGHFGLYAFGKIWAADPGYGNDNQFPDSRCHTLAHNCVLIDGGGQARSGCGTGTNGYIRAFENDAATGYALVDAAEAYQHNYRNEKGVGARKALRHNLFVRPFDGAPAYAAVFDDIEKDDDAHDFTWQMLTWDDKEFVVRETGALIREVPLVSTSYVITPAEAKGGRCRWEFETKEKGVWQVYAQTAAMGDNLSASDSFVVQVDGSPMQQYHAPSKREWAWGLVADGAVDKKAFSVELAAGRHVLTFSTREREAALSGAFLRRTDVETVSALAAPLPGDIVLGVDQAEVTGGMEKRKLTDNEVSGATVVVRVSAELPFANGPAAGVYAPQDGRSPKSFPRLRAVARTVNPHFAALLLPLPKGMSEPRVTETRKGAAVEWRIAWASHEDVIRWDGMNRPQLTRD